MKILIVEDDSVIAGQLVRQLAGWGYETVRAEAYDRVLETFAEEKPQLVLLDLSLPGHNGFYWCEQLRKLSTVPIIIVSSASDRMDIVMAMNMGADDYITKPFDMSVLTAKVQAVLRRSYDFAGTTELVQHGGAVLNKSEMAVNAGSERLELSKNEYKILEVLMENAGKPVRRDTLMMKLWETDCFVDENTLSVNVARLRKKLAGIGLTELIATKKGVGYYIP